jgi:hypothetical protein
MQRVDGFSLVESFRLDMPLAKRACAQVDECVA